MAKTCGGAAAPLCLGGAVGLDDASASSAGDPPEKKEPAPVELAIAPKGGVPSHPEGTRYKSPFAKPNAKGQAVKVATMLNSIDDYDIKTGKFTADFYMSLTSAEPMPDVDLHCANGNIEQKTVLADRPTFKLYRMFGTFKSPANLRKYPFDSQDLASCWRTTPTGQTSSASSSTRSAPRSPEGSARSVGASITWRPARSASPTASASRTTTSTTDATSSASAWSASPRLHLQGLRPRPGDRPHLAPWHVGAPGGDGSSLQRRSPDARRRGALPYSLMQELPATSYLMRADKLMLGVYISLLLGMLSTWTMFLVKEKTWSECSRLPACWCPS